jgi:aminodeoxyfutalosine deaminase
MTEAGTTIFHAAAVRDAAGVNFRPGAIAVRAGCILAAGAPHHVDAVAGENCRVVEMRDRLILPALVNAHAHLDLTSIGPRPFGGDFVAWLRDVVQRRPTTAEQITAAVHAGLKQSHEAGVGVVGDIAGTVEAVRARLNCPGPGVAPGGVSFLECFGLGRRQTAGFIDLIAKIRQLGSPTDGASLERHSGGGGPVFLGIQPHAPYSAGLGLYNAAGRLAEDRGLRLSTHLAESPSELEFIRDAAGPLADLLHGIGKWDDTLKPTGLHPVDWLEPELRRGIWLAAHCNCVEPEHIQTLVHTRTSVAYCPRASAYFGFPPQSGGGGGAAHGGEPSVHPYLKMLDAGVNVCLGTDSILCQPPDEPQPLGILPQMRFLYRRDGTDPGVLLTMATINGLRALDLDEALATLRPGTPTNLIAVQIDEDNPADPLAQALENNNLAEVVDERGCH